jgi:hypothetical protein
MHTLMTLHAHLVDVLAAVPDPGGGEAPPGSEGFLTILSWAAWIASGVCVAGVLITGGRMAINSRRGEGGEHAGNLAWVMGGAIVIGSAAALIGAILPA